MYVELRTIILQIEIKCYTADRNKIILDNIFKMREITDINLGYFTFLDCRKKRV